MVFDNYFLLLPVYRIDSEKYQLLMDDFVNKELYRNNKDREFYEKNSGLKLQHESYLRHSYGGPWEFNEIIGFIKLYFYGNQVRGEYWATMAKRIVKSRKKQYEYKTHKLFMEITIKNRTNECILNSVREYIDGCKTELKNRYIDTREFENLSMHLDWVSLFKRLNSLV